MRCANVISWKVMSDYYMAIQEGFNPEGGISMSSRVSLHSWQSVFRTRETVWSEYVLQARFDFHEVVNQTPTALPPPKVKLRESKIICSFKQWAPLTHPSTVPHPSPPYLFQDQQCQVSDKKEAPFLPLSIVTCVWFHMWLGVGLQRALTFQNIKARACFKGVIY